MMELVYLKGRPDVRHSHGPFRFVGRVCTVPVELEDAARKLVATHPDFFAISGEKAHGSHSAEGGGDGVRGTDPAVTSDAPQSEEVESVPEVPDPFERPSKKGKK